MRRLYGLILLGWMMAAGMVAGQSLPLRIVALVPGAVPETSGLICTGPNRLWSHNDGGNAPEIYEFDTSGTLLRTLTILGEINKDWEDLTRNDAGEVFIGDFGNNDNNRTDLAIFKLPDLNSIMGDSVLPGRIEFSYEDQVDFPPVDTLKNFDMEAFVAFGDSLYLFSKNRTNPFDGFTKLYRLPQDTGTYVAELIDSFYTGPGPMVNYWVAGAALSPGKDHLILVSYARCWIFSCFQGADFFGGAVAARTYSLRQMEAAAWKDSTHVYLTDELINGTFGGNLYEADVTTLVTPPNASLGPDIVYAGDTLVLWAPIVPGGSYLWSNGATTNPVLLTAPGTYWLQSTAANGCVATDTIDISFVAGTTGEAKSRLHASPNPFHGTTMVELELLEDAFLAWSLRDSQGRLVMQSLVSEQPRGVWRNEFGEDLKNSIYFLDLEIGSLRYGIKLVKQ